MSLKDELDAIRDRLDTVESYLGFEEPDDEDDEVAEDRTEALLVDLQGAYATIQVLQDGVSGAIRALDAHYAHLRACEASWGGETLGQVLAITSALRGVYSRTED